MGCVPNLYYSILFCHSLAFALFSAYVYSWLIPRSFIWWNSLRWDYDNIRIRSSGLGTLLRYHIVVVYKIIYTLLPTTEWQWYFYELLRATRHCMKPRDIIWRMAIISPVIVAKLRPWLGQPGVELVIRVSIAQLISCYCTRVNII